MLTDKGRDVRENRASRVLTERREWKTKYKTLVGLLDSPNPQLRDRALTTLAVMENQAVFMEGLKNDPRTESTFVANLGQLVPKVVDLVRIFYPNLVANELVDIQPMDRQNGEVFIIKPVFSNSAGGVNQGDQVFAVPTDGTYASEDMTQIVGTGNGTATTFTATLTPNPDRPSSIKVFNAGVQVATDDGNGNVSGTGVSGTINYTTGALSVTFTTAPASGNSISVQFKYNSEVAATSIRELELQLSLVPVTAQPHPLRVKWSTQAQLAAAAHLDLDIPDTLANLVASFIRNERDMTLINAIVAAATHDTNLDFDAAAPTGYSRLAKYAEIELKLNYGESSIQKAIGRGGVSWVLCGNNASDIFRNVNGFEPSDIIAPIGPHKIGTLRDGTVAVIKVPAMNANTYVIGFKGYVVGDASTILAEWIPLYASPVFNSYDLNNYQGMMSLYAMVMNNTAYYRTGTISNYTA